MDDADLVKTVNGGRTGRIRSNGRWLAVLVLVAGCGDSESPSSPTRVTVGTGPSGEVAVISITVTGVTPSTVTVQRGGRVLFTNRDSRPHEMKSDPYPDDTDCPELNQVGILNPGESRESAPLMVVRTCRFHDDQLPLAESLQGSIIVR